MKTLRILLLAFLTLSLLAAPALAQLSPEEAAKEKAKQDLERAKGPTGNLTLAGAAVGAGLGAAITLIGAGLGFGRIGASALESMARQPEVAPRVQTAMIIIGALLEGATFFALLVCLLVSFSARW